QLLQRRIVVLFDWPLWALIDVTPLHTDARFSVCVNDNFDSGFLKPLGQLSNKELGPTVVSRRDRDEGRRYEGDFQCRRLIIQANETLMPGTGHPLLLHQLGFGGNS